MTSDAHFSWTVHKQMVLKLCWLQGPGLMDHLAQPFSNQVRTLGPEKPRVTQERGQWWDPPVGMSHLSSLEKRLVLTSNVGGLAQITWERVIYLGKGALLKSPGLTQFQTKPHIRVQLPPNISRSPPPT